MLNKISWQRLKFWCENMAAMFRTLALTYLNNRDFLQNKVEFYSSDKEVFVFGLRSK